VTWLLDALYDGAYCVDRQRRITYWNPAAERLTGYRAEDVVGRSCAANILNHLDGAGACLCEGMCPLAETMRDCGAREGAVYLHHRDGHRIPVQVRCVPLRDDAGAVVGGLEIFSDISSEDTLRQRVDELEKLAFLDGLTSLPNRRYLEQTLAQRFDEYRRYGNTFGVMMADIDRFKAVNDTYGHDIGDRVLTLVGQTLGHNCRVFDVVGRWGGEEFVGVFAHLDAPLLLQLAERLRRLVAGAFLTLDDARTLTVTLSLGVTLVQPGDTTDTILQRADHLLYASKAGGRNRVTGDATV
jgi:diguanylate cyclase (GGDEF)-like protein/PAS domain S-box-containing protein